MKKYSFTSNNYALAGVIEALLLIGLVAVILSTIQLYYVPEIMEQKESEHMDEVLKQFSLLKSTVDIQSLVGSGESDNPIVYAPMSTTITLGSSKLPYLVSLGASGQIEVIDEDKTDSEIEMDSGDLLYPFENGIPLTSIKYTANNYYFPESSPGQEYILEGGGIILKQSDGEVMKVAPSMIVENHTQQGYLKIIYNIPYFTTKPDKDITSGYKNCYARTNYISNHSSVETLDDDEDKDRLKITTEYINAWNQTLIKDDSGILWEYYHNEEIWVNITDVGSSTFVTIEGRDSTLDFELKICEIGVQVSPGETID